MKKSLLIYGTRSVIEAVRSKKSIEKVLLQEGLINDRVKELEKVIKEHSIPFAWVPIKKINSLTNKNHQGVVGFLTEIPTASLQQIIDYKYSRGHTPFFLLLDRVTDVRNFGAVSRTCECAGLDGIVITDKGNAPITSDAVKTSAGALNHLPICKVKSLSMAIKLLQDNGIHIVACTEKATKSIYSVDFTTPTAILLGSEQDGISQQLLKEANTVAKIPMKGNIESLNISVAAGIVIYEALRQKEFTKAC